MSEVIQREVLWRALDSFWRNRTAPDTRDFVRQMTYAGLTLYLELEAEIEYYLRQAAVSTADSEVVIPWLMVLVPRSSVVNRSFRTYGDGGVYAVSGLTYGEAGPASFLSGRLPGLTGFDLVCDSLGDPQGVLLDVDVRLDGQDLVFEADPFSVFRTKTSSGGDYLTLWLRNARFDLGLLQAGLGWVAGYRGTGQRYTESLRRLWSLLAGGPNLRDLADGVSAAVGHVLTADPEVVESVTSDGYYSLVITDKQVHRSLAAATPVVGQGDAVLPGDLVFDSLQLVEGAAVANLSTAELPGLAVPVRLSTGPTTLVFRNTTTSWTYSAGRPHPWRFEIDGDAEDVEQYWVDLDLAGTDLSTVFTVPGSVNPMQLVVGSVLSSNLLVLNTRVAHFEGDIAGFTDAVRRVLPSETLFVINQFLASASDSYDAEANAASSYTYGLGVDAPGETISVSTTDLIYTDYTPLVAAW